MKKLFFSLLAAALIGCDDDPELVSEAPPLTVLKVVEVGQCTVPQESWAAIVPSICAVRMSDDSVKQVPAPVMVGQQFITCPEQSNNINNERCVLWYGARKRKM